MAYELLCAVPFVVSPGSVQCPGDAYSIVEVVAFSWDQVDLLSLAARFAEGFSVMIPVIAAVYGFRLIFSLIKSA